MNGKYVLIGCVIIFSASGWLYALARGHAGSQDPARPTVVFHPPEASRRGPSRRVLSSKPPPSSIPSVILNDEGPEAAETASETSPPPPRLTTRHIPQYLDAVFSAELVDSSWSRTAAEIMRSAAWDVMPEDSSIRSLECRATLCRLEVQFPSVAASEQFIDRMFDSGPDRPQFGSMIAPRRVDDSSGHTVTFFVSRDARTPLPPMEIVEDSE